MPLFSVFFPLRMAALASIVVLSACSKKSDDPTPVATIYNISWTVDGKDYTAPATSNRVTVNGNTVSIAGSYLVNSNDYHSLTLNIPAAVGTYDIRNTNSTSLCVASYQTSLGGSGNAYTASNTLGIGSGTIKVNTFTATDITGTFSFAGTDLSNSAITKTITNGKFAIKR